MLNLLTDPLIRTSQADGSVQASALPEVYAGLLTGRITGFPGLTPHQEPWWHTFLVQLSYLALTAAGAAEPPTEPEEWRRLLRQLTPAWPQDQPWQLAVPDRQQPAFLQPPAASSSGSDQYQRHGDQPDCLDLAIAAKNHDSKQNRFGQPWPEHWLFALIARQTADGYLGRGNYPIFRMNGGLGSRPFLGLTPSLQPGPWLRRDLTILLQYGAAWYQENSPLAPQGKSLLWLEPWDGEVREILTPDEIHPAAIEVCRRLRLELNPTDGLQALKAATAGPRVQALPGGISGDPWTPARRPEKEPAKVLTMNAAGFSPSGLSRILLDPEWQLPLLARPAPEEIAAGQSLWLTARVLARGQGRTEGWHSWQRQIPPELLAVLAPDSARRPALAAALEQRSRAQGRVRSLLSQTLPELSRAAAGDLLQQQLSGRLLADLNRLAAAADLEPEQTRWVEAALKPAAQAALEQARQRQPASVGRRPLTTAAAQSSLSARTRHPERLLRSLEPSGDTP